MSDLFEEYKALFNKKNIKLSSPFMINRLLSFSKQGFRISTIANKFISRIPNELLTFIYQKSLKEQKAPYVKFPRKQKIQEEELLKKICRMFNCRIFHSKQIMKILKKEIDIKNTFGIK